MGTAAAGGSRATAGNSRPNKPASARGGPAIDNEVSSVVVETAAAGSSPRRIAGGGGGGAAADRRVAAYDRRN